MLPYRLCSHFTFAAQSLSAAAPRGAPVVAAPEIQTFVCLFLCLFLSFRVITGKWRVVAPVSNNLHADGPCFNLNQMMKSQMVGALHMRR